MQHKYLCMQMVFLSINIPKHVLYTVYTCAHTHTHAPNPSQAGAINSNPQQCTIRQHDAAAAAAAVL